MILTEATAMLENFWPKVMEDINKLTSNDFKNQELPLARIKKIMKLDDDVKIMMISAEAPVLFAKAAEMFITELSLRAWLHTEDNKRRTLQRNDIAMAVSKYDQFDFLIDIVPREELKPVKKPTTPILTPPHILTTTTGTVPNAAGTTVSLDAATLAAANGTSLVQQDQVQYLINQAAIQQQANAAAAAGQQIQLIPQSGLMMTTGPNGQPQLIYVQVPTAAAAAAAAAAATTQTAVNNNASSSSASDLNQTVQTSGQPHQGETTTTMMATGPNGQPQLIYVQVPSSTNNAAAVNTNQSNSTSDLTSIVQTPGQSHGGFTQ